jgi:hypothetical protein
VLLVLYAAVTRRAAIEAEHDTARLTQAMAVSLADQLSNAARRWTAP